MNLRIVMIALNTLADFYRMGEKFPHQRLLCQAEGIVHHDRLLNGRML
jgi:hypothetical protein